MADAAQRLAAHLRENPELGPTDVAYSLATTRSAFEHRAVALGQDREELLASLSALANGDPSPNVLAARATEGKLACLLTGQGSQRLGMGKELYESDPHFQAAFDRVCEQLDQHLEAPLKEIVFAKGKKAAARLEDTTYAQPALFAIEVALYEALAKRGLKPDLLAGHSIGEIAAAQISGVLDLPDASKLIAARGRLMGELPAGGAMAAIEATEAEAAESIAGEEAELALAAINGPSSTVISGAEEAVEEVRALWEERGRKTKRLRVSHAFHSPLMEPMLGGARRGCPEPQLQRAEDPDRLQPHRRAAQPRAGDRPRLLGPPGTRGGALRRCGRDPRQAQGASTYVELGPDPVLCAMARESLGDDGQAAFVPTLREGRTEAGAVSRALAHAHAAGAKLEWGVFFKGTGAKRVPLPTYPFQRERYWLATPAGGFGSGMGQGTMDHPLLGSMVEVADDKGQGLLLSGRLSLSMHPWLADHVLADTVLLPGTAFLELALRAAERLEAQGIEELTLQAPLAHPRDGCDRDPGLGLRTR